MDEKTLYKCLAAFQKLLDTKYHIVLGRCGKSVSFDLTFTEYDCHHLMGIHYLEDRPDRRSRSKMFLMSNSQVIIDVSRPDSAAASDLRDIYLFLDKRSDSEERYCKSIFSRTDHDYTIDQAVLTLLYKETHAGNQSTVLYQHKGYTP